MIVIADTSPVRYLIETGLEHLLPCLFNEILIPQEIEQELLHPGAPAMVRRWIESPPDWIKVPEDRPSVLAPSYKRNLGEQAVIRLAQQLNADLLLIDDFVARRVAERSGFTVIGTLGILSRAARRDLVNIESALSSLRKTNFRTSDALLSRVRADARSDP